jgi:hypothetical protein
MKKYISQAALLSLAFLLSSTNATPSQDLEDVVSMNITKHRGKSAMLDNKKAFMSKTRKDLLEDFQKKPSSFAQISIDLLNAYGIVYTTAFTVGS